MIEDRRMCGTRMRMHQAPPGKQNKNLFSGPSVRNPEEIALVDWQVCARAYQRARDQRASPVCSLRNQIWTSWVDKSIADATWSPTKRPYRCSHRPPSGTHVTGGSKNFHSHLHSEVLVRRSQILIFADKMAGSDRYIPHTLIMCTKDHLSCHYGVCCPPSRRNLGRRCCIMHIRLPTSHAVARLVVAWWWRVWGKREKKAPLAWSCKRVV